MKLEDISEEKLLAARQIFSSSAAQLEQMAMQRVVPGPVEVRQFEKNAVIKILKAVLEE